MTPIMQDHARYLLGEIAKNPIYHHGNKINIAASIRALPPEVKVYLRTSSGKVCMEFLRTFPNEFPTLQPVPACIHQRSLVNAYRQRGAGLRVGPRVHAMSWEEFKKPWVYELVCEPTGRRYIGVANRPDLRRAVHYFWLRNIDVNGPSNIFRKNDKLRADLAAHGPDSFYFDVLERVKHKTGRGVMTSEEWKWIQHYGADIIFNDIAKHVGVVKRNQIQDEIDKLWVKSHKTWDRIRWLTGALSKLRAEIAARRRELSGRRHGAMLYYPEVTAQLSGELKQQAAWRREREKLLALTETLMLQRRALQKKKPPQVKKGPPDPLARARRLRRGAGKGRGRPPAAPVQPESSQGPDSPQ